MKAHVLGVQLKGSEGKCWAGAQQEVTPDKAILHNGHIQAELALWTAAPKPHFFPQYTYCSENLNTNGVFIMLFYIS